MRKNLGKQNSRVTLSQIGFRLIGISAIVMAVSAFMMMNFSAIAAPNSAEAAECVVSAGNISGFVFYDYNNNGVQDAAEPGISGVTVSGYISSASGTQSAGTPCETRADGAYDFAPSAYPVRVEFTLPASLQTYLKPAPSNPATGNGSSVQIVTAASTTVNAGFHDPADYCQNAFEFGTTCFSYGVSTNITTPQDAVVSLNYFEPEPTGAGTDVRLDVAPHTTQARTAEVGSVLGLAYHGQSENLFAAAWVKRHVDLGPDGAGAIYKIDTATNTPELFFDLNSLPGAPAGEIDPTTRPDPVVQIWVDAGMMQYHLFYDTDAYLKVGTTGIGDIDLSPDQKTLFAVNMADKKLYSLPGDPAATVTAADVSSVDIPNTCPNASDARPMALGYNNGSMYVGSICTAESIVTAGLAQTNDITFVNSTDFDTIFNETTFYAEVFEYDIANETFNTTPVLILPLTYDRGCIFLTNLVTGRGTNPDCSNGAGTTNQTNNWRPWQPNWEEVYDNATNSGSTVITSGFPIEYPQPILSDIEFDGEDMLLGLRDLNGDRTGHNSGVPDVVTPAAGLAITQTFRGAGFGDLVRACWNTTTSTWDIESNGTCGTVTTAGAGEGEGPGGGEYYWNDSTPGGANNIGANSWISQGVSNMGHAESTLGMLMNVEGLTQTVAPAIDISEFYDSGFIWFNDATGASDKRVKLFDAPFIFGGDSLPKEDEGQAAGKGNGIGDLEALCMAAPIEVGNLIWIDTNRNGVQDPGESGAAGVTVQIFAESDLNVPIATAVTDANGHYYFSSGVGTNSGSAQYGLNLLPETAYRIVIEQDQAGTPIDGFFPTAPNTPTGVDGDIRDSDGISITRNSTQYVDISFTTGVIGENDHTFDTGFTSVPIQPIFRDWGDLPETFTTTANVDGPRHILVDGLHLGECVDGDPNGGPSAQANGDDENVLPSTAGGSGTCAVAGDDEDGIIFRTFTPNNAGVAVCTAMDVFITGWVPPTVSRTEGYLNAWADLNADGTFTPDEQFVSDNTVNGALVDSTIPLQFTAPVTGSVASIPTTQLVSGLRIPCEQALVGANVGFRFRFTLGTGVGADSPFGEASSGEVEDYILPLYGWDFGDSPESTDASDPNSHQTTVPTSLFGDYKDTSDPNDTTTLGGGARHIVIPGTVRLGTSVATEINGEVAADGSTTNSAGDGSSEEDGWAYKDPSSLLISRWDNGQEGFIRVNVTQVDPVNGACVYGFIDWEGNGFKNGFVSVGVQHVTVDGDATLTFPASAERDAFFDGNGSSLRGAYVRFRVIEGTGVASDCSARTGTGDNNFVLLPGDSTGYACSGEVEDYYINFTPLAVTMQEFRASQNSADMTILLIVLSALSAATLIAIAGYRRQRQS
ncbi:MAG: SdrD B-like domain-containing protein [Anaerolineae bacterium]